MPDPSFYGGLRSHLTRVLLSAVVVLCALAPAAWAQKARFDSSILSQGQPVRQLGGVNDIVQDGLGFIWIGGESGLGRYDGTRLRLYQAKPGVPGTLPNNYIWDMEVDKQGRLWIGTSDGLSVYEPETDSFRRIEDIYGQPLLSEIVSALAIDHEGKIYAGGVAGLNVIDPLSRQVTSLLPQSPIESAVGTNTIQDLDLDADGNLWIGMALEGVARLDPGTGKFDYFYHDENRPNSLSSNRVKRLHADSSGRIWVATYGGGINLIQADTGAVSQVRYRLPGLGSGDKAVVMDVLEDLRGEFWVSVDQQGLLRFDAELNLLSHFAHSGNDDGSLLSNQVRDLYEDVNGDLWVGVFPYGVSFLDRSKENIHTYRSHAHNPRTLSHSAILSLVEGRDGTVWVGTENGLNALDPDTGHATRYLTDPDDPSALSANAVLSIAEDASGDLWLGTWSGGLNRLDPRTGKFRRYPVSARAPNAVADPFVWAVIVDQENTVWLGSETGGLQRYRPETDDFVRYQHDPENAHSISGNYVLDIIADRRGRLWVATYSGLNLLDKTTETFRVLAPEPGNPNSISSYAIRSLFEDSRGFIWVGTHDKGLNRLHPETEEVVRIGEVEGLPSPTVSSIVEDAQGYIWAATQNGLARLHPETLQVKTYGIEHGLIGATYIRDASLLDSRGRLYFGCTEGISVFNPDDIEQSYSIHPTRITNFRILNREVPVGVPGSPLKESILTTDRIQLKHSDNMFSFDFVTLNFRNSELNSYAYQLEGFDTEWNYVDHRSTATYTNLDPGRYVFRVYAKAPGERWTESEQVITIDIASPPWRTWWAFAGYAVLGSIFIYAVYAVGRLKKTSDNYKELSVTDPLTGAYNRAGISQLVQGLFANAQIKSGVCVMLMDIDHFKRINDKHGHDAGDRVIMEVARVARTAVRQGDYLGRWGGEEFILLCPSATPSGGYRLAEKIRNTIAEQTFALAGSTLDVTVSIGVAMVGKDETFDSALKRADTALYEAKSRGRNRTVCSASEEPLS